MLCAVAMPLLFINVNFEWNIIEIDMEKKKNVISNEMKKSSRLYHDCKKISHEILEWSFENKNVIGRFSRDAILK